MAPADLMAPRPPAVVVVGAGISGLACAHRIAGLLPDASITVVEAGEVAGGKIRTTAIDGIAVDEGADAFLARIPAAVNLCRELGLADQLVTPAERRAFVYRHGALHRFPADMVLGVPTDLDALAASGLVSADAIAVARADADGARAPTAAAAAATTTATGPGGTIADESVGALVRRHAGDEIFDAFVGPLLSGVHAGDPDQLSVAAGAPQFAAAVREHGSLIRGLQAQRDAARAAPGVDPDAPVFFGLRDGTQTLTDALVRAIGPSRIRLASRVEHLERDGDRWTIAAGHDEALRADAVVLATPAFATAALLSSLDAGLAEDMAALEYASVVLVTLAVPRSVIGHPLDGSGFLVSEGEGLLMTACSFGSSKWAHWQPANGDVILRASCGRQHDRRALDLDDDALVARLLAELGDVIDLQGPPTAVRVSRYDDALPQFRPGHLDRAAHWKEASRAIAPGLYLTGACYFGLGIPACITDAERTAHELETWWSTR